MLFLATGTGSCPVGAGIAHPHFIGGGPPTSPPSGADQRGVAGVAGVTGSSGKASDLNMCPEVPHFISLSRVESEDTGSPAGFLTFMFCFALTFVVPASKRENERCTQGGANFVYQL